MEYGIIKKGEMNMPPFKLRFWIILLALLLPFGGLCLAEGTRATIISTQVISKEQGRYIAWPTVAKTSEGELIAVFSGDRDEHVCPWGKTEMIRSSDGGKTWTSPVTVNNTPLDDRDAGIIVTRKGTLLVTWFTSLAFTELRYIKNYPEEVTRT